MASLTATGLTKTPTPSQNIGGKTHQYPQFLSPKQLGLTCQKTIFLKTAINASNPSSAPTGSSSPGLYSAQTFELTARNVDLVLEDVRPYLIADGGNVDVVSVEEGVVSLKLQGVSGFLFFFLFDFIMVSILFIFGFCCCCILEPIQATMWLFKVWSFCFKINRKKHGSELQISYE